VVILMEVVVVVVVIVRIVVAGKYCGHNSHFSSLLHLLILPWYPPEMELLQRVQREVSNSYI